MAEKIDRRRPEWKSRKRRQRGCRQATRPLRSASTTRRLAPLATLAAAALDAAEDSGAEAADLVEEMLFELPLTTALHFLGILRSDRPAGLH